MRKLPLMAPNTCFSNKDGTPSKEFYTWLKTTSDQASAQAATASDLRKFNIIDFGASTTSPDNSGAIQDAFDAVSADGGVVTAPPGRYQMAHGVTLTGSTKPIIIDFNGAMFFMQDDTTGSLFTFQSGAWFKNANIEHFGTGGITDGYLLDNANAFVSENVLVSGEFGSVQNCCRMVDSFDVVFFSCNLVFATNGLLADNYNPNFLTMYGGAIFGCECGVRIDTAQSQSMFFLGMVVSGCTQADFQINGAVSPTWLNCDLEGIGGSPGVGTAFNFYSAPIVGATISGNFLAFRNETIQNLQGSSFVHNCFYNENIVFDSTNVNVEIHDNFVVGGSGPAGITANAATILTVAQLPPVASVAPGTRKFVNTATATTFHSVVAGGGANLVPVVSSGAQWLIG